MLEIEGGEREGPKWEKKAVKDKIVHVHEGLECTVNEDGGFEFKASCKGDNLFKFKQNLRKLLSDLEVPLKDRNKIWFDWYEKVLADEIGSPYSKILWAYVNETWNTEMQWLGERVSRRRMFLRGLQPMKEIGLTKGLEEARRVSEPLGMYRSVEYYRKGSDGFGKPYVQKEEFTEDLRVKNRYGWDLVLDIDVDSEKMMEENIAIARERAVKLYRACLDFGLPAYAQFSGGKGVHVLPMRWEHLADHYNLLKMTLQELVDTYPQMPELMAFLLVAKAGLQWEDIDTGIYTSSRVVRVACSLHQKTLLVCLPLTFKELQEFKVEDAKIESVLKRNDLAHMIKNKTTNGDARKFMSFFADNYPTITEQHARHQQADQELDEALQEGDKKKAEARRQEKKRIIEEVKGLL